MTPKTKALCEVVKKQIRELQEGTRKKYEEAGQLELFYIMHPELAPEAQ